MLGCMTANLLIFNTKTDEIRVRVGTIADRIIRLNEIEAILGSALHKLDLSISGASDSLVYRSWDEKSVLETASFSEMVGSVFPGELVDEVSKMLTDQRFICVPVICRGRALGVVIFTKEDVHPFGRQQRQILLQYAQRIGEIVDNEFRSRGAAVPPGLPQKYEQSLESQLVHLAVGDAVPAVMVDAQFRIVSCNEATSDLIGCEPAVLFDKPIDMLFDEAVDIGAIFNHQFLFHSDGHFEEVIALRHRSGDRFFGKVEAFLLVDEENEVIGFLVLIRKSGTTVGGDGYDDGMDQLMRRERLATMGEMAAQLAHEIRNPLVSIGATLEMLAKEPDEIAVDREVLNLLAGEVTRIDMILKEYLSLSVRQNTSVERVNLGAVVGDAAGLLGGLEKSGERISLVEVDPGIEIFGDYLGLRQVIVNLLKNAAEAGPPGSEIACRVGRREDEVFIHIDDQGQGLPMGVNDCFKPFFTTKKNGTGLGLTVCQKIIEAHRGTITLFNRRGGGCRAAVVFARGDDIEKY
jgi:signal transduction histidine kinase